MKAASVMNRELPERGEGEARARRIVAGVVPAMALPFVASVFYFRLFPEATAVWVLYGLTKLFTLVWPVVAVVLLEGARPRLEAMDWRRHWRAAPFGLLSGLLIGGVGVAAFELTPLGEYVRAHAGEIQRKVESLDILDHYIVYVACLSLIHSLLEEYYWRWYVFGRLAKVTAFAPAAVLASLAFAAHHYVVLSAYFPAAGWLFFGTCVAIGGAFWCWLYRRQRTLVGAWMSHMMVDVAVFYIGYRLLF